MAETDLGAAARRALFMDPDAVLYAILDGASVPRLRDSLDEHGPEYVCLYRGELEADLADAAPYLVRLEPESPFTAWVFAEGWGRHWGVFAYAEADLITMRKHFRRFLMVALPDDRRVYFRYYDPRVLAVYLPTCNAEEAATIFGPVAQYAMEGATPGTLLRFAPDPEGAKLQETELAAG